MAFNLKNDEAIQLARDVAELSGETLTTAILTSLAERKARLQRSDDREERLARVLRLANECADRLSPATKALDHGELLYDDKGLPA